MNLVVAMGLLILFIKHRHLYVSGLSVSNVALLGSISPEGPAIISRFE